jgi:hypothetical protein
MPTIKITKNLGLMLAGVWLLLWGVIHTFSVNFPSSNVVLGIIALIAGVLVVIDYK